MSLGLVAYGSSDEEDSSESGPAAVVKNSTKLGSINSAASCSSSDSRTMCNNDSDTVRSANNSSSKHITKKPDNFNTKDFAGNAKQNRMTALMNQLDEESLPEQDTSTETKPFGSLPAPNTTQLHNIDFDWSRLTTRSSTHPIKISVPALANLESEEDAEPVKKKLKPSKSGSGLFALLPSPKNSFLANGKSSLMPRQVKNSKKAPAPGAPHVNRQRPPTLTKFKEAKGHSLLSINYDESGDEDEPETSGQMDFFSLASTELPDSEMPIPADDVLSSVIESAKNKSNQQPHGPPAATSNTLIDSQPSTKQLELGSDEADVTTAHNSQSQITGPSYIPFQQEADLQLDQTALQQLCGRRERRFGGGGVDLIEIDGESMLPDAREWMTKQLTEEQNVNIHKHNRKDGPTTQQRRKHQITYLAFQAKEHELELKNQWANNRMSRKQTQAKYGF